MNKIFIFGPHLIPKQQVFFQSSLSIAIVNIRPIVSGHVLVLPIRKVKRFVDLFPEEIDDLFQSTQKVTKVIENYYNASSMSIVIQDGPDAGQTVPHVHVHVIPRRAGDFPHNDDVYTKLEESKERIDHPSMENRTLEDMIAEASLLAKLFHDYL